MSVLTDNKILLRSAQPTHPLCSPAVHAVTTLLKQNETVFFCPQNNRRGCSLIHFCVAVANTYGMGSILTFNGADFRRYANIAVLDPLFLSGKF
jgi:hypothetical protein